MKDSRMAVSRLAAGERSVAEPCRFADADAPSRAQSVDLSKWSPEYIRSIAGTETVDTAADCAKITPLDYKGRVSVWWTGPNDASPDIDRKVHEDFWAAWKATYPNIETDYQNIDYNQLLDKLRTATLGNAAPMVVRLQILGGVEFASKGYFQELKPEDVGYPTADFWPGAIKSVMYDGTPYGIPTNNETMAFIWNADIFERAGLDPESPPKTWDDVVTYSKTDPRQARHRRLRPGGEAERRQHAVPLHAAALGLWRRRARRGGRRSDLPGGLDQQRGRQGGAAGLLRHVRARQVGADLGADQHPEREPGAVHRRPARDDDRPPGRVRQDGRPRLEGDRAPTRRWPTRWSTTCATA